MNNNLWDSSVFDSEFALVDSFPQPCKARNGLSDLEWDGELIWGAADTVIYGFTTRGTLEHSFRAPYNPTRNIAYDPQRQQLWVSGTTSDIAVLDLEGNAHKIRINKGLRIYGLGWDRLDLDGYPLQILQNPGGGARPGIYKMNNESGDTMKAVQFSDSIGTGVSGLSVITGLEGMATALTIRNIPEEDGGDRFNLIQLRGNADWITLEPLEANIDTGGSTVTLNVCLRTMGIDRDWSFGGGAYQGEITILSDGRGGELRIPVQLTVTPMSAPGEGEAALPLECGFRSIYPEPFNAALTIEYRLAAAGEMRLNLTDILGRNIATLTEGYQTVGDHRLTVDMGARPSGIYYITLETAGVKVTTKAVCLK